MSPYKKKSYFKGGGNYMWTIILKNNRQELRTARQIVRELQLAPDTSFKVKTLIVQNILRQHIVALTEKLNKKGGK